MPELQWLSWLRASDQNSEDPGRISRHLSLALSLSGVTSILLWPTVLFSVVTCHRWGTTNDLKCVPPPSATLPPFPSLHPSLLLFPSLYFSSLLPPFFPSFLRRKAIFISYTLHRIYHHSPHTHFLTYRWYPQATLSRTVMTVAAVTSSTSTKLAPLSCHL